MQAKRIVRRKQTAGTVDIGALPIIAPIPRGKFFPALPNHVAFSQLEPIGRGVADRGGQEDRCVDAAFRNTIAIGVVDISRRRGVPAHRLLNGTDAALCIIGVQINAVVRDVSVRVRSRFREIWRLAPLQNRLHRVICRA